MTATLKHHATLILLFYLLFSIFSYMLYRQKLQERLAEISTAV